MLNSKFPLNRIVIIFFILFFFIVSFLFFIQYYKSKEILTNNFIDKYKLQSLKIKDKFSHIFDESLYIYKIHEKLNVKNTFRLNQFYKNGVFDIKRAERVLNSTLDTGKYEIFQIDRNYKIINGTFKPDIGYDLGKFEAYKKVLDAVFSGKEQMDISYIHLDINSKNLKKYYLIRSKDVKYLLQLAYVVDIYPKLKRVYDFIKPSIKNLQIFFVDKYLIYPINFQKRYSKKLSVTKLWEFSKQFFIYLSGNKKIADKNSVEILNYVIKFFKQNNNMIYKIKNNNIEIYTLLNGVVNNKNNRLIIQTNFSLLPLKTAKHSLFINFLIIFLVIALFFMVVYFFVKYYFIKPLKFFSESMKENKKFEENSYIKEIDNIQKNYNMLYDKLTSEIAKNKELLLLNRRFVVDTIHQIRTPLNVILLNIELLRECCDDGEILDEIEASISMLSNSYEDLAYISSNNVVEYKAQNIDISFILKERIDFFVTIAKSHNKHFAVQMNENAFYKINKIELERIIDNNISNAIKYSKGEEIIISLIKKENKYILKFETTGEKIKNPKEIFEKNYREQTHKRGLGIGLNIVKNICEKYGINYSCYYQDGKNIFEYQFLIKF